MVLVLLATLAYLNPSGVEGGVLILPRADKYDVLKPVEAIQLTQLVETGVLDVSGVRHGELSEGLGFTPLFEEPHAGVEKLVVVVHVAQVGG